jgi:hypothetical protein
VPSCSATSPLPSWSISCLQLLRSSDSTSLPLRPVGRSPATSCHCWSSWKQQRSDHAITPLRNNNKVDWRVVAMPLLVLAACAAQSTCTLPRSDYHKNHLHDWPTAQAHVCCYWPSQAPLPTCLHRV